MAAELTIDVTAIAFTIGAVAITFGGRLMYLARKVQHLQTENSVQAEQIKGLRETVQHTSTKLEEVSQRLTKLASHPAVSMWTVDGRTGEPVPRGF